MKTNYAELTEAFEKLTIDPANFGHIEHVGVAYTMLLKYDFLTATAKYAKSIHTIATCAGAANKFNMTITIAFLSLIAERMSVTIYTDADDFFARNQDLMTIEPIKQLYSGERLHSQQAHINFLLPDLTA
ncbi:MAG: hypothetical protein AAF512_06340 [Pseudomonadota bacterium]